MHEARTPAQDLVVQGGRADEPVLTTGAPLPDAEEAYEIGAVAVEAQVDAGLVQAHRRVVGIRTGVAHVAEQVARSVLGDGGPHVEADPPVDPGDVLLLVVSLDRDPLHVEKAPAVLQGLHPAGDLRTEDRQREVFPGELAHGQARPPGMDERTLDVVYLDGSEVVHPAV